MIKIVLAIANIFILQYIFGYFSPQEGIYMALDPVTMLIVSGIVKAAGAGFSLSQASRAKSDMEKAETKAKKYLDKAYDRANINTEMMRTIDPSLYETAQERVSQDLSTALDVTAGDDPRLQAVMGTRLAQQAQQQRQAIEMQKRKDIQDLEADIAKGEAQKLARLQALDLGQVAGFQQQAAEAQQRRVGAQQSAFQQLGSIIGDYTGLIEAGVSPQQISKGFQGLTQKTATQPTVGQPIDLTRGSQLLDPNYQAPNPFGFSLSGDQVNPLLTGLTLKKG